MAVLKYWWLVLKLAWRESKATLLKSLWRIIAIFAITVLAAIFLPGPIVLERILLAFVVPILAVIEFLWQVVAIPARLHRQQLEQDDARRVAEGLDEQYQQGIALLMSYPHDVPGGDLKQAEAKMAWWNRNVKWRHDAHAKIKAYSESDAFWFRELEPGTQIYHPSRSGPMDLRGLEEDLRKLHGIIERAYRRINTTEGREEVGVIDGS